jgi:hypothetical protein
VLPAPGESRKANVAAAASPAVGVFISCMPFVASPRFVPPRNSVNAPMLVDAPG